MVGLVDLAVSRLASIRLLATSREVRVALTLFLLSEIAASIVAWAYGSWVLGKPLGLQSFCRWDCDWYATIVAGGYDLVPSQRFGPGEANWAFFPLFPLLAAPLHRWLSPELSLILAGRLFFAVSIYLFIAFVAAHRIALSPWVCGSLVAFGPSAIYAQAGYAEPLYFALCTGALLALKGNRWLAAGLLGGACSATRLVGLFLTLPMLARLIERAGGNRPPLLARVFCIAIVPLGVALFAWHLYARTGDFLAFAHIQAAWDRALQNPWRVWWHALRGDWAEMIFALIAAWAVLASVYLWARGMLGYGLFLAAATLLPMSSAIFSMPRFVFWQPVFLLGLAEVVQHRLMARILLPLLWAASLFMTAAWFSDAAFVT